MIIPVSCTTPNNPSGCCGKKLIFSPQYEHNHHLVSNHKTIVYAVRVQRLTSISQILDENPSLHFSLLRLQLVELIRSCTSTPDGDISPALEFATSQLAPRAPTNPQFLEDLERTLALLIFPSDNLAPSLAALLDPSLRKDIATRVNEAILQSQGAHKEARLRNLVKLRAFAENKARDAKKDIPEKLDLGLMGDAQDGSSSGNQNSSSNNSTEMSTNNGTSQNGARDTVMTNNGSIDPMIS